VRLWWDSWHSIRPGLRHPQAFPEFQARWRSEIVPRHDVVVAADGDEVVGFAAADVSARVLAQIFVEPGRKHEGIGSQMLVWARTRMPKGFRLETLEENQASRAFYERHGLTVAGTGVNPVNGLLPCCTGGGPVSQDRVRDPIVREEATAADPRREATTLSPPPP
jgi:putative acetyltransferase